MKTYSISSYKSWQVLRKYCVELDYNIQEIQHYIDFINPNKIILNYTYSTKESNFYSNQDLQDLGILHTLNDTIDGVDINFLYNGQIVYNSFGINLFIYNNNIKQQHNNQDVILKPGYAVFKVAQEPYFLIMSLDSEGDFYTISNITESGDVIFTQLSHATVSMGTNYICSFAGQNARWVYCNYTSNDYVYYPSNWEGFTIFSWTWPDDHRIGLLTTKYGTLWTISSTISHDILKKTSINGIDCYEEIFCTETTSIESKGLDKGSLSLYSINTNMINNVATPLQIGVYIY